MKMSVHCETHTVYVDGEPRVVCKKVKMPDGVHAIQWWGARGEVEFVEDNKGRRPENEEFFDLKPYQYLVDAHAKAKKRDADNLQKAKDAREAARKAQEEADRLQDEAVKIQSEGD